jgi:hypothetical protein
LSGRRALSWRLSTQPAWWPATRWALSPAVGNCWSSP